MSHRTLTLPVAAVLLLIAAAAALMLQFPGSAGAQAGEERTARAGDGETGYSVNLFLPEDITVETGTTVRWSFPWFEPHTLTYMDTGNPAAPSHPGQDPVDFDGTEFYSSGLIAADQAEAALTFTAPGEYEFYCLLHPFMLSTVTVVDDGETDTQEAMDAAAEAAYDSAIADLKAIAADLEDVEVQVEVKADGSKRYTVIVSGANMEGDVMQFFPDDINIEEGDTLLFRNETPVPHTATLGPLPDGVNPMNIEDEKIAAPQMPGDAYEGTGYWNTGIIGVDWPAGLEQEITFAEAGTYDYYCILHAQQGMVGTIVVGEAADDDGDDDDNGTATPEAPTTGSGLAASDGGAGSLNLALGAAALAVIALGGGVAIRARR